jgi:prepilin-type N-terminal cleavage/methylation domain-containing protein
MLKIGNEQGFTLVELLITVLVIGIVYAIAIPKFINAFDEAHKAHIDLVESSLKVGVTIWASDNLLKNGTFEYPPVAAVTIAAIIEEGAIDNWSDNGAGVWTYTLGTIGTLTYAQTGGGTGYTVTKVY